MTKTIITAAAILFAASVQATDSRKQFISGNPDSDNSRDYQGVTAAPPSFGAHIDRYQGIDDGNPDLFAVDLGVSPSHDRPDIYGALGDSPDLSY